MAVNAGTFPARAAARVQPSGYNHSSRHSSQAGDGASTRKRCPERFPPHGCVAPCRPGPWGTRLRRRGPKSPLPPPSPISRPPRASGPRRRRPSGPDAPSPNGLAGPTAGPPSRAAPRTRREYPPRRVKPTAECAPPRPGTSPGQATASPWLFSCPVRGPGVLPQPARVQNLVAPQTAPVQDALGDHLSDGPRKSFGRQPQRGGERA